MTIKDLKRSLESMLARVSKEREEEEKQSDHGDIYTRGFLFGEYLAFRTVLSCLNELVVWRDL